MRPDGSAVRWGKSSPELLYGCDRRVRSGQSSGIHDAGMMSLPNVVTPDNLVCKTRIDAGGHGGAPARLRRRVEVPSRVDVSHLTKGTSATVKVILAAA